MMRKSLHKARRGINFYCLFLFDAANIMSVTVLRDERVARKALYGSLESLHARSKSASNVAPPLYMPTDNRAFFRVRSHLAHKSTLM